MSNILLQFKHTRHKLLKVYFNLNRGFIGFLQIIDVQNQLSIIFGTALVCNKILRVRNISSHIKSKQKVIRK